MSYSLQIAGLDGRTRRQCVNVCDICLSWPKSELQRVQSVLTGTYLVIVDRFVKLGGRLLTKKINKLEEVSQTKKTFKKKAMNLPEVVSFQTSLMSSSIAQDLGLATVLLKSLSRHCEDRCCACVRLGWSRSCGCLTTVSTLCPSKTQTHQIHAKHYIHDVMGWTLKQGYGGARRKQWRRWMGYNSRPSSDAKNLERVLWAFSTLTS